MHVVMITTLTGEKIHVPTLDAEFEADMAEGGVGLCIRCGEEAHGVEPDARGYECEDCGARQVFGLEELVVMGLVRITDEVS